MPVMRMRNLGSVGVVTDLPPYELPPHAWTDALNVRFQGTKISSIGGNIPTLKAGMPSDTTPLSITGYGFDEKGIGTSWVYGTKNTLYKADLTGHKNVSKRVDGTQDSKRSPYIYNVGKGTWYYTTISNALVMTTKKEVPQGITPSLEFFNDLPNWGKTFITYDKETGVESGFTQEYWRAEKIRTYKNFLIALNMKEGSSSISAKDYSQRVRWSNITDIDQLPVDWDHASTSGSAGFNDLTNAKGIIVDGVPLRDMFIIYTSNDVFNMQYIGGNNIFRFTKMFNNSGLLAPECAVEYEGNHFVVSPDDIYVHNGSTKRSVVTGRIKDRLIQEITSVNADATKVFANAPKKEMWITYVSEGSRESSNFCNKAAIWNWEYNTWTFHDLPAVTDVNMVNIPSEDLKVWSDFTDRTKDTWKSSEQNATPWFEAKGNFLNQSLLAASNHGRFYLLDQGDLFHSKANDLPDGAETVQPLVKRVERALIDFDELEIDPWQNKRIRRIYPQFKGKNFIEISVDGNHDPYLLPSYSQSQTFDMKKDIKSDFRVNDKYISIKFEDHNAGSWDFAGYDIDFILGGRR